MRYPRTRTQVHPSVCRSPLQPLAKHLHSRHLRPAKLYLGWHGEYRCEQDARRVRKAQRANLKLEFLFRALQVVHRRRIGTLLVDPVEYVDASRREVSACGLDRPCATRRRLLGESTAYTFDADEEKDEYDARRRVVLRKDADGRFIDQGHEDQELSDCREREKLLREGCETKRDR